jgi:hypothetical protein
MAESFGYLNLKPSEFWDTTPREFQNMMNGFKLREDSEWQKIAQQASWIMSPHSGKKTPTPDKLLGKENNGKKVGKVVSIEEKRSVLDELEESLGKAVSK